MRAIFFFGEKEEREEQSDVGIDNTSAPESTLKLIRGTIESLLDFDSTPTAV